MCTSHVLKKTDTASRWCPEHIAFFLSSLAGGGAERVVLSLAAEFAGRGLRVDLVLANLRGELVSAIPPSIRLVELGAAALPTVLATLLRLPSRTWRTVLPTMIMRRRKKLRSLPRLVRYLQTEVPQVVLSSTDLPNLLALWAGWLARVDTRLFLKADNSLKTWVDNTQDPLRRKLPQLICQWYPHAHGIAAVSAGLAAELAAMAHLASDRISVIYNPIDCGRIGALAAVPVDHPWFQTRRIPVILAAGRLHPQKDYPTLLQAFASLRKQREARLAILGEGPERERLQTLSNELGISGDVHLMGFQSNPFAYMVRSAVFVLSSAWEGLSNVLIEALVCGCRVVSTDCPHGPAEVLAGGRYGLLVPVGEPEALAQAIQKSLDGTTDPEKLRQRARQFDIETVADRYLQFFFQDPPQLDRSSS